MNSGAMSEISSETLNCFAMYCKFFRIVVEIAFHVEVPMQERVSL